MSEFSLFRNDPLNRLFAKIGIGAEHPISLVARFSLLLIVTALPTAMFCWYDGYTFGRPRAMNLFGDIAAWGQAFLGYPLFIISEVVIGNKTEETARHFLRGGIIANKHRSKFLKIDAHISALARRRLPEIVCFLMGFIFALLWLKEEMGNGYETWHAIGPAGAQWPTKAGWWAALVGIPIFNFWWLRSIWKIVLWCFYLFKVSRFKLQLIASHPDMTGGLAFLSQTQASFAIVIFAFGFGIIAPLIGYKLEIEGAAFESFAVAAPLFSFIIGAPIFFSVPLLFFTKQLAQVKKIAVFAYHDRARDAAMHFEERWLTACKGRDCDVLLSSYLSGMNNLHTAYNQIKRMRVVPFDIKSFTQLLASTAGSLLPIIPKLMTVSPAAIKVIEFLKAVLPKFG